MSSISVENLTKRYGDVTALDDLDALLASLPAAEPVFWLGLGGEVGSSDQYVPWISIDDVLGGLYHLLWAENLDGPVNLTAPRPARMARYAETLAGVLNRPAPLRVPPGALRAVLGEMAEEMVLKSARVVPERLQDSGYDFGYSELSSSLRHVLGR